MIGKHEISALLFIVPELELPTIRFEWVAALSIGVPLLSPLPVIKDNRKSIIILKAAHFGEAGLMMR